MGFTFPNNLGSAPALTVPLVMFGWIPIVLYLFSRFPARKAVVISFITAWLFLPEAQLALPGLPDYDKMSATCYGIMLATFIFDVGRFSSFRFSWIDIPMLVWCLCPFASSVTNGLGPYDGFTAVLDYTMTWGVPYFLGRIYLNSLDGLRQLAVGIFVGGLIYVPFCLFESRFSPQLHRIIYGGHAYGDFAQNIRLGGYRPTVFMQHGLAVSAFMMAATLIGIWLWQSKAMKRLWGVPVQWLVAALLATFVLTRSTGALILFAVGMAILLIGKQFRTALPVFALIIAIGAYLYINAETDTYFSDQLVAYLSQILPPERVASMEYRFNNEELLVDKAREQIMFGWAGWGRALVPLDDAGNMTVQDSLWIIAFGHNGTVGLTSLFTSMLLPVFVLFWTRYPAYLWFKARVAPTAAVAVTITLYMIDCILNAMINPIYILACGGVAGVFLNREKIRRAVSPQAASQMVQQYLPQARSS